MTAEWAMNELCNSLHAQDSHQQLSSASGFCILLILDVCKAQRTGWLFSFSLRPTHGLLLHLPVSSNISNSYLVLPGICQWNRQECKQNKINFPGWHRLLGIYSIFQIIRSIFVTFRWTLWINCRLQLVHHTSMTSPCGHHMPSLFLSQTPTYATPICAFKQSKRKGFHKSPVENLSIEMHLSGPHLILFLHSSHLDKFQWL